MADLQFRCVDTSDKQLNTQKETPRDGFKRTVIRLSKINFGLNRFLKECYINTSKEAIPGALYSKYLIVQIILWITPIHTLAGSG